MDLAGGSPRPKKPQFKPHICAQPRLAWGSCCCADTRPFETAARGFQLMLCHKICQSRLQPPTPQPPARRRGHLQPGWETVPRYRRLGSPGCLPHASEVGTREARHSSRLRRTRRHPPERCFPTCPHATFGSLLTTPSDTAAAAPGLFGGRAHVTTEPAKVGRAGGSPQPSPALGSTQAGSPRQRGDPHSQPGRPVTDERRP